MKKVLVAVFALFSMNAMAQHKETADVVIVMSKVKAGVEGSAGIGGQTKAGVEGSAGIGGQAKAGEVSNKPEWVYSMKNLCSGVTRDIYSVRDELKVGEILDVEGGFPGIYKVKCLNHTK